MQGFFTALIIKHFVADFLLQTSYQYRNKGTLFHPGGLLHGLITIAATTPVLIWFQVPLKTALSVLAVEFLVHYFMDFTKIRIDQKMGWHANTHRQFFILLGFDQMVHYLSYVWIVWYVSGMVV